MLPVGHRPWPVGTRWLPDYSRTSQALLCHVARCPPLDTMMLGTRGEVVSTTVKFSRGRERRDTVIGSNKIRISANCPRKRQVRPLLPDRTRPLGRQPAHDP